MIRKSLIGLVVSLFLLGAGNYLSFAQWPHSKMNRKAAVKLEVVVGKIVSIDPVKNEIVVQENDTGVDKTFVVNGKLISSLKVDEEVKVKAPEGSNAAKSVKALRPKKCVK